MKTEIKELVESSSSRSLSESDNEQLNLDSLKDKINPQIVISDASQISQQKSQFYGVPSMPILSDKKPIGTKEFIDTNLSDSDISELEDEEVNNLEQFVNKVDQDQKQGEQCSPNTQKDVDNLKHKPNDPNGWRALVELDSLPLMKSGYSLEADMKFGWKPTVKGKILPIPFVFDSEDHLFDLDHFADAKGKIPLNTIYQGWRPQDSFKLYRGLLSNIHPIHGSAFPFKVPSELPAAVQKLLDQQMQNQVLGKTRDNKEKSLRYTGMNPDLKHLYDTGSILEFDSSFESGNLDRVVMVTPNEYDLYMRPDTNTRGHHQWFYFKVTSKTNLGPVKFNIINFTKPSSLHELGMKICYCSAQEKKIAVDLASKQVNKNQNTEDLGWKRGGYDISYEKSKLNDIIAFHSETKKGEEESEDEDEIPKKQARTYFQLSFTFDFNLIDEDDTYFSYSYPYTFSRLIKFLHMTPICHSLSGVDIPFLIVTSRANQDNYNQILPSEHSTESIPAEKTKRTIVLTGRVHPGESNASFMMEGFIKFITSKTNQTAIELRKRIVFKIVPCVNPDGVMAGNYRVSMSGNDLNRRYLNPHSKLHPIVCAIKKLIKDERPDLREKSENPILAFIDMHGHSRKKNVFMYGPEFPIHDNRYISMRIIPKLMSEHSEMFRFYSCKFRLQKSKEKTARIVLWREFGITNCYTLEASFYGYFDSTRETRDFLQSHFYKVGTILGESMFEYVIIKEDEGRQIQARKDLAKQREKEQKLNQKVHKKPESKLSGSREVKKRQSNTKMNILSPSASSEAILPSECSDGGNKIKLNNIKKKSTQKEGKKKQFKVTKKFKDDIPPKPPKKQTVNPNEPEEDKAESSRQNTSPSPSPQSPVSRTANDFVTQYRMKKRTFEDICNQIENDEDEEEGNVDEDVEVGSEEEQANSGEDKVISAKTKQNKLNEMGSDSEDDVLLMKIHNDIIGLLNADNKSNPIEKIVPKQIVQKDQPKKNQQKKMAQRLPSAQKVLKTTQKKEEEKKVGKFSQAKKLTNFEPTISQQIQHQTECKPTSKSKSKRMKLDEQLRKEYRREKAKAAQAEAEKKQVFQNITPSVYPANVPSVSINCNNFNDRIMNEQYTKHKTSYSHGTTGAAYQLSTLSSGAQKLLNKQLQQDQLRRMQVIETQNQASLQREKEKSFAYYNFQARRDVPQKDLNLSINISHLGTSMERHQNHNKNFQNQSMNQDINQNPNEQRSENHLETSPDLRMSERPQFLNFNPQVQRLGGENSKQASSSESLHQFNRILSVNSNNNIYNNQRQSQPQMFNTGFTVPQQQEQNMSQYLMSNPHQKEAEEIGKSQNQRNRRLIPQSHYVSSAKQNLEELILDENIKNKLQSIQQMGGSLKDRNKLLAFKQSNIISQQQKVVESDHEESPLQYIVEEPKSANLNFAKLQHQVQLNDQQVETPISAGIGRTSIQNQKYQEELFAKRSFFINNNDPNYKPMPQIKLKQNKFDKDTQQPPQIENSKRQIEFSADMKTHMIKLTNTGVSIQEEQQIPLFLRPHTNAQSQPPGHRKYQSTIYMTNNDAFNLKQNLRQDQMIENSFIANQGARSPMDVNQVMSQNTSPSTSIKAKARMNQHRRKQTDFSSFQDQKSQNQGLQTIKSQLLAQSEINQQLRQQSMRKAQKAEMVRQSIKTPKFQSLLKPDDPIYPDKSCQSIREKSRPLQQKQIMQQEVPQSQKIKTNKTIHFAARNLGGQNKIGQIQNQFQNPSVYNQKQSERLNQGYQQQYVSSFMLQDSINQKDKQKNKNQLHQNVYNDLQELQRELNQTEIPIQNLRTYAGQFKIQESLPEVDEYLRYDFVNDVQTQQHQSNEKQRASFRSQHYQPQMKTDQIFQNNMISHQELITNNKTEGSSHAIDSLISKMQSPQPRRSQLRNYQEKKIASQNSSQFQSDQKKLLSESGKKRPRK